MSIHLVGVAGLVLVFVIGTLRPINLGTLALVMTFLVGTLFAGESVNAMVRGFPVDLLVVLAGVTYLFAVASENRTVERIVDGAARLVQDRRALIPWIVFGVASLPAMAGALGSAGVAMLAPLALRLGRRYGIDRRMIGLMLIHGAAAGNFSPLNVLGALVREAVGRSGLQMSPTALFLGNIAYNLVLGVVIYVTFGGLQPRASIERAGAAASAAAAASAGHRLEVSLAQPAGRAPGGTGERGERPEPLGADQVCTLVALLAVAVAALGFGLHIGFLAFAAAAALQLIFPASSGEADRKIAWSVVLLVCGIVTYVAALERYGTVQAVGDAIAGLGSPRAAALLLCSVGALTSAFASSAGILGALMPLAVPFMARGEVDTSGLVTALAISATVVDSTPFSTVGALVVANAEDDERRDIYRGLLLWGAVMVLTAPLLTWLLFVVARV